MTDGSTGFLFSTPEMTRVFSLAAQLRAMTRFEWALTCALEKHGIAATGSGSVLLQLLDTDFVEIDSLKAEAMEAGNIAIPFVHQLTAIVRALDEEAARTVHLGATSQDVLDTALVLQMHDAFGILDSALDRLEDALVQQVRRHADTVLTGRTWLQPGPPTTLGLKLAGTLAALRRHRDRIHTAAKRALVLEFGGAVGTLSALGESGTVVSRELARLLDLQEPQLPWHTQRDNLVAVGAVLALLVGTLGKFAKDIALLMQAEVGEASESVGEGRGASSTMPQKHNPVGCAAVLACAARTPGLVATLLNVMPQEHERGLGLWQSEWETFPEIFRLTAAALARSIEIAQGLEVNPAQMRANLDARLGLAQAEAVSVALAQKLGRSEAHELLRNAVKRAAETQKHLATILQETPEVTAHLDATEIEKLLDPNNYLGSARSFIERVLEDGEGTQHGRE
jgi:3-carboxy-cis,cis-muconate cycloisomerase